ncbi:1-phosphofructokinase [Micromonospora rhizosphaerae]|uniref:1-phosphofructokinase n=1 Tax=Micromonospora rhizosphaerae TaxID=568872 RepID=A0A1C6SXJ0_9ACTN|nr:PfkB family carbohydrate kinase [Micromonospora rhizosphaerae]SCL34271.1 1-phosphofructokinase [Micromonospora rhizosphaerae]
MLIATPNITVDRTVRLPELRPGSVLRPYRAVVTAGGKGVNVGRAAAAFGRRPRLVSFRPETDADVLARLFAVEPMQFVGVPVPGDVRVATIYLEDSGRVTVLNEPGPQITAEAWQRYEQAVADELATGEHLTLVCSGSLPPGVPDDGYGRLATIARRAGVRVVVDAARAALAGTLGAGPDLVTPNLAEAEGVLWGQSHEAVDEAGPDVAARACAAVTELCRRGARSAAVTAGAAGAAFGDEERVFWVPTVPTEVVNPIGAGDSFVGGLVEAFEEGREGVDAVVLAVAAATASVEQELAGGVDPERTRQLEIQLTGRARPVTTVPWAQRDADIPTARSGT